MNFLVDTSIWVSFFRGSDESFFLCDLIKENLVLTNDLILTELTPFLKIRKEFEIIDLLSQIKRLPLLICWEGIRELQFEMIKKGFNGIGIPDLIIFQNAKDNNAVIASFDSHLQKLCEIFKWPFHKK
jgi:predicted nucleic acid-binding protein